VKAVIMAGGEGTRLRPLTSNAPKPLLPMADRPMMEHVIRLLARHGISDIVVTVAFMANAVRDYFGDGAEFGVSLTYVDEPSPLGTAGSVRNAAELLDDRFLVISGDVITDIDLTQVVAFHEAREALATIALTPVENPLEFGIVITHEDGSIERFLEKPTWGQVFSDTINTGIYVLEPDIFEFVDPGRPVDFSADVFPRLLRERQALFGAITHGYWEDVGTLDAYLRVHKDVLDQMVQLGVPGFQVADGVWVGQGTEIGPDVEIVGPAVIGPDCTIEAGSRLGAYTVLGSHCRVLANVDLDRCVLHDSVYVGQGSRLRGTVVGKGVNIRANVRAGEGVVLGDEVQVGANATLGADVKVYPFKTIEDGAVVNSSIIWESRGVSALFGRDGVDGLANVDMTPDLAVKLALAYGTSLRKGVTVVTSRDSSRSARMLKRALMAGLNSSGVNVLDLEVASTPVTRFLVKSPQAFGGLTVRLRKDDPNSVAIHFYDTTGMDISEEAQRKIERLFQREDYRRTLPEEMGDISYPHRALEDYTVELSQIVEPDRIAERQFKLVVDYGYGTASLAMASVLTKLRADVLAVNPYASTIGRLQFDLDAATQRVADLVRASGAQLGAVFDSDGERVRLIDDEGDVLTHVEATLVFVELVCDHLLGDRIALPVNMTAQAQRLAAAHGVTIQHTKISTPALMEAAVQPGVGFAADGLGGYILPGFLPAFDAAAALVKMLDLLARSGRQLSEVRRGLPAVYMTHEAVATPWEQKGLVMRSLMEKAEGELVLVDGVKVCRGPDWALALPDPQEPVTHLWAEATTAAAARALSKDYARRIRRLVR
jgi:mannose-1-phosphate guanylyltransferase/phosphomannomutase